MCGPASLSKRVRGALCAPVKGPVSVLRGGPSVELHVEQFGIAVSFRAPVSRGPRPLTFFLFGQLSERPMHRVGTGVFAILVGCEEGMSSYSKLMYCTTENVISLVPCCDVLCSTWRVFPVASARSPSGRPCRRRRWPALISRDEIDTIRKAQNTPTDRKTDRQTQTDTDRHRQTDAHNRTDTQKQKQRQRKKE